MPFFLSSKCHESSPAKGKTSLAAATAHWGEDATWRDTLAEQLRTGSFTFVAVAQRFTDPVLRTIDYLNATMRWPKMFAVELVAFAGSETTAFEGRAMNRPESNEQPPDSTTAGAIVDAYEPGHRAALASILDAAREAGFKPSFGSKGLSLRWHGSTRVFSIGWLYPPGSSGYRGSTYLTLGCQPGTTTPESGIPSDHVAALQAFHATLQQIDGGQPRGADFPAFTYPPAAAVTQAGRIETAIRELGARA